MKFDVYWFVVPNELSLLTYTISADHATGYPLITILEIYAVAYSLICKGLEERQNKKHNRLIPLKS